MYVTGEEKKKDFSSRNLSNQTAMVDEKLGSQNCMAPFNQLWKM